MGDRDSSRSSGADTRYAMGLGLLLAWWAICHESGMLFLAEWPSRVFSCMASNIGGAVALIVIVLAGRSAAFSLRRADVYFGVMLAVGMALDLCAPLGIVWAIVPLEAAASTLLFYCIVFSSRMVEGMGSKALGRIAVVALTAYCLSEAVVFLVFELVGNGTVRGLMHTAVLVAGAILMRSAFASSDKMRAASSRLRALSCHGVPRQLVTHVLSYTLIFGMTHVLASGVVPVSTDKIAPSYIGTGLAALLVCAMVWRKDESEAFWPLLRQYVFPVAMLGFILLPFANTGATLVSVAMAECASSAYFAFLLIAAVLAAKKIGLSAEFAVAVSLGIASVGMEIGIGISGFLRAADCLVPTTYNILTAVALAVLCAGTFWVGNDKQVFYVWGLEKRLTPKRFADRLLENRCRIATERYGLTKREGEVLLALAQKQTPQDIADRNFIALNTVRTHIARIHRKTQTHSQREIDALLEKIDQGQDA